MKRITSTIAGFAAIAIFASASSAQSTKPVSLGISAGAAIPVSDLGKDYTTGYNGTVSLGFNSYGSPIGLRIDGMYNHLSHQGSGSNSALQISSANANLVYALPGTGIRPYLIGGGGIYGLKSDIRGAATTTKFGLNGGLGASFPLSGFNTFVEGRLHHVFTDDGFSTNFIPVTFGISF